MDHLATFWQDWIRNKGLRSSKVGVGPEKKWKQASFELQVLTQNIHKSYHINFRDDPRKKGHNSWDQSDSDVILIQPFFRTSRHTRSFQRLYDVYTTSMTMIISNFENFTPWIIEIKKELFWKAKVVLKLLVTFFGLVVPSINQAYSQAFKFSWKLGCIRYKSSTKGKSEALLKFD